MKLSVISKGEGDKNTDCACAMLLGNDNTNAQSMDLYNRQVELHLPGRVIQQRPLYRYLRDSKQAQRKSLLRPILLW